MLLSAHYQQSMAFSPIEKKSEKLGGERERDRRYTERGEKERQGRRKEMSLGLHRRRQGKLQRGGAASREKQGLGERRK